MVIGPILCTVAALRRALRVWPIDVHQISSAISPSAAHTASSTVCFHRSSTCVHIWIPYAGSSFESPAAANTFPANIGIAEPRVAAFNRIACSRAVAHMEWVVQFSVALHEICFRSPESLERSALAEKVKETKSNTTNFDMVC